MLLFTALASFVALATKVAADPSNDRHSHVHSLTITKHIDPRGKYFPVKRDSRRFTHLMNKANGVSSLNLAESSDENYPTSYALMHYVANIGVGVPPTNCMSCVDFLSSMQSFMWAILDSLIVDTASSNTWVGAITPYSRTSTSVETPDLVVSIASYVNRWTSSNQKPMDQNVTYPSININSSFTGKIDFFFFYLLYLAPIPGSLYNDTVTLAPGVNASDQPIGISIASDGISRDGVLG